MQRRHAGPDQLPWLLDMSDSSVFRHLSGVLTKLRPYYHTVFCTKVGVSVQPRLQVWVQCKVAGLMPGHDGQM